MCIAHVSGALKKIANVTDVVVSLEEKTADIYSTAPVSDEDIEKAIVDAGYKFLGIKNEKEITTVVGVEGMT